MISFQVVIMALLGGAGALFGPLLGAVPLVLLFEVLQANFPNAYSILLGAAFVLIVYGLPRGVIGLIEDWRPALLQPAVSLPVPAIRDPNVLTVADVRKSFGGLKAVDGVSFEVRPGEIVGLVGPNGSGKTTVLNLISGALGTDAGQIAYKGRAISGSTPETIARLGIARTFQLVRVLPAMSVAENVIPGFAFRTHAVTGRDALAEAQVLLARVGLDRRAAMPAADLTYIDQKRLELARALALEPKLLLLDEWLAGLNPTELEEGIELIQSLRNDGLSIIMVEHVMDAIHALCDRCVVMSAGRVIAEGTPRLALAQPEVVSAYLGVDDDA
jgi:branched-chain amino acid transport system permease protein